MLTGCLGFLKPARPTARFFLLTPLPPSAAAVPPGAPGLGVGRVKMPAYLFNTSVAVRRGANEVEYLSSALWAERLDTGFQRVLAANLAALIPTDRIRVSSWIPEDVGAEVYVDVDHFDVDSSGCGVLVARWRILSSGGEKILKAGETRVTRQGSPPESEPAGAVGTMSDLVADLSRQVSQAFRETTELQPIHMSQ